MFTSGKHSVMLSTSLKAAKESPLIFLFVCGLVSIVGFEREAELPNHSRGGCLTAASGSKNQSINMFLVL